MGIVDFILNLAGLLLWLNWRSIRFDPLTKRRPATLMGTLRPATPPKLRRWHLLVFLAAMLFIRALIYCWLAPFWTGKLDFGVTMLSFRSDWFGGMLIFSFLSFGLVMGVFHMGLLFLSLLSGPDPIHGLVKIPLGRVDNWPRWAKLLLPLTTVTLGWFILSWLLGWWHISPQPTSLPLRLGQSLVVALSSYLVWKFPAGALLALYLLNSYIYFGKHPFWKYISTTTRTLLLPLGKIPLRIGRVDFAPVLAVTIIFFAAEGGQRWLMGLYTRLVY